MVRKAQDEVICAAIERLGERMRASAAMERGKAAGWEQTANGRVLLGVLAKRAAGLTRQMTTEEIMAQYRANKGA